MRLAVLETPDAVAARAAATIAAAAHARPDLVLGLATGRTMEPIYAELVRHVRTGLDLSRVRSFNLDEYLGLAPGDPRSYASYMATHLFGPAGMSRTLTRLPDGQATDPTRASRAYDDAIRAAGGIDLQLLGLGENGHIGFNEPGSSFASRTRVVTLTAATRRQNAAMFDGDPASVPLLAITMGIGTIMQARSLLLVATGVSKARAVARAFAAPVSEAVGASVLQRHADASILLDREAAREMPPDDATR